MLRSFLTSNKVLLRKQQTGLFILTVVLAVFIPLYPKLPLVGVAGTFVAVRLEDVLIAIALLYWLIYIILNGQVKKLISDKLIQALFLFFFAGALSVISAVYITQTIAPHLATLHYLRRVELMMLLPLAYTAVRTRRQLMILLGSLGAVTLIVIIYAFGQQFLHWPLISTTNSEFSKGQILYLTPDARVSSSFAGHYDLAVYLMMVLSVVTAIFFGFKNRLIQLTTAVIGAGSFIVLVMTAARFSFAAALGGIALSLVLVRKKIFLGLMVLAAILAIAYPSQLRDRLVSTVSVNLLDQGERFETPSPLPSATPLASGDEKSKEATSSPEEATLSAEEQKLQKRFVNIAEGEPVDSTQLGVYRSLSIRLDVEWPRALRAFYRNIFLGSGYAALGVAVDNDFLRALGETGLIGTTAFLLILLIVLMRLITLYKSTKNDKLLKFFYGGTISMLIAFCLNGIFIDVFEASKVASLLWLFLGASLGLRKQE